MRVLSIETVIRLQVIQIAEISQMFQPSGYHAQFENCYMYFSDNNIIFVLFAVLLKMCVYTFTNMYQSFLDSGSESYSERGGLSHCKFHEKLNFLLDIFFLLF